MIEASKSPAKTKLARSVARLVNSNPWSEELESSLSSLSPSESFSKTTVLQTLRLVKTPAKALRFFDWVSQKGFSHNDQSFFLMLEVLGRARNLNVARNFLFSIRKRSNGSVKLQDRFFNSLIRSYGNAGLFQASIKLFETMKEMGVSPSVVTFNSLFSILLKRGKTGMVHNMFDEMLHTYGVTPDSYTYNILIRGFCKDSMVHEGFRLFKEMEQSKCHPNVVTYNTIVDGLCRAGKVKIAHNVVKGMMKKGTDLRPNIVTYTTLVRGYCMKHEIDEALAVFREMLTRGLKPNDITYNTLIKGLCEAQRYEEIKEILDVGGKSSGFAPDACTYNILIAAHCDAGNLDAATKVFGEMVNLNVQPDSASYSILIRNFCQRKDFERAEALLNELLEKEILLGKDGCKPLFAAYNPVFTYLCANGKTEKAEKVFRQLMKRGTQDSPSYKTLIMGFCREGKFKAAYELLVLMLRQDFEPEFEIYEFLINGLLKKGEAAIAYKTLQKMLRSSHLPGAIVFHSILAELVKAKCPNESFGLLKLMLEKGIRQNMDLSTHAVISLFSSGQKDKGFQIVTLLYDNGYLVDMEKLLHSLCESRNMLEAHRLLLFCMERSQSVDTRTCDTVIEELCRRKRPSEAFGLYYELVEKGNHQQLNCHDVLRNALEAAGKRDELHFVLKRMALN
ncbi:PREDICTED: pentatricopeptide repeat-containing protein At1g02060, chloroplastic [Tarenaya hassleriana]|uniref:pentatricopeptide repeat-containing protein At1g02060, chloroplastic n=1 Tax=Tarenaya hassleriana TaxID=28532 RepID=UPI00053C2644|nr:PREDICTED: pentatricopeptide repeat-containing protein At1g02060, chloroplastic [Tarenaya hassleriana]